MNNSPICIVGCPRSGTSLLRNLLRSHPRLTFPGESHFIPCFFKAYGDPKNERESCKLAARILSLEWVRLWELSLDPSSFAPCRSYSEIVSKIYEEWTRKENKLRWGDKTPQYVLDIPILSGLFPECRIIHLIRDGRDVALSWLNVNFGPENVFTAASAWKYFVNTGCHFGSKLPSENYLEIRYEKLLSHTEETLGDICVFLGEQFHEKSLNPYPLKWDPRDPILGTRHLKTASQTEIVGTNQGKWREKMSSFDRTIFESVAGDLLTSLGYETEGAVRRITKAEQIFWESHHSFWWLLARLDAGDKRRWIKTDFVFHWAGIRNSCKKFRQHGHENRRRVK